MIDAPSSLKPNKLIIAVAISILAIAAWVIYFIVRSSSAATQTANQTNSRVQKPASSEQSAQSTVAPTKEADSASTLEAPQKVTTADGKQYFYYGAPAGQNNASPKKIVISLPGHGTTAESDYAAWQTHISGGSYALASLNWWDGSGETKADYYPPLEVVSQTRAFLTAQGYESADIVILEGFSRGSANTYAVIANDRGTSAVFDAVISASGGYQSDFPLFIGQENETISATLFKGVPWVLACGGKDDNPERDGCPGMENTKTFLTAHGANVLGLIKDPNVGHGAFHKSSLDLPKQALDLIAKALGI